jgi:hypothetical protein
MMEECGSPRRSAAWRPHETFADAAGMKGGKMPVEVTTAENAGEKAAIHTGHHNHVGNNAV